MPCVQYTHVCLVYSIAMYVCHTAYFVYRIPMMSYIQYTHVFHVYSILQYAKMGNPCVLIPIYEEPTN